eukprot:scaffold34601_cov234-Amphora_coffeaeformis.AAC.9
MSRRFSRLLYVCRAVKLLPSRRHGTMFGGEAIQVQCERWDHAAPSEKHSFSAVSDLFHCRPSWLSSSEPPVDGWVGPVVAAL